MTWSGTDYNEKLYNGVHNGLVGIYLDGVKGISADRGGRMVPQADADRILERAGVTLAKLVVQTPPSRVKGKHAHLVEKLSDLIEKATAVRNGGSQKMTEADYAANRKAIGIRR